MSALSATEASEKQRKKYNAPEAEANNSNRQETPCNYTNGRRKGTFECGWCNSSR